MTTLRLALAGLLAALGLVVVAPAAPSYACSCAGGGPQQHLMWADTVFTGTLTSIEETPPAEDGTIGSMDPTTYSFDVDQSFKGGALAEAQVVSARMGASCGLEWMKVESDYLVFAYREDGELHANLCGGTEPAERAPLGRIALLTGTSTTVSVGQPVPELVTALLAIFGLTLPAAAS